MSSLHEVMSGKNINFLIGSGASYPITQTLKIDSENQNSKITLENLLTSRIITNKNKKLLYYYYYENWISVMRNFNYRNIILDDDIEHKKTLEQYIKLAENMMDFLSNESNERPKRVNIFTTNYDMLFEHTFEKLITENQNCFFNDGSTGFITRVLNTQNFSLNIYKSGYSDSYKLEIPTINLLKLHGSVSWKKRGESEIILDYSTEPLIIVQDNLPNAFKEMKKIIIDNCEDTHTLNNKLEKFIKEKQLNFDEFYEEYKKIAIINPNKWKFNETVFEQHYYQIIRNFSYELEKENTILVVFGFSFADEHILDIFKRSLSNPKLQVFIICYDEDSKNNFKKMFKGYNNISYYPDDFDSSVKGDFQYLNNFLGGKYEIK